MSSPLRPGTRWRATTRKHRGWRVCIRRVGARSVEFERLGAREPSGKRCFMATAAFRAVFAPEGA
jgi:hypothetical protein